jgi:hypothetical protein
MKPEPLPPPAPVTLIVGSVEEEVEGGAAEDVAGVSCFFFWYVSGKILNTLPMEI